jgi:hypothetical protein
MASGAHVRVEGLQGSDGGVVALPDLGLRVGCGNWIIAVELRVRRWAGPVL